MTDTETLNPADPQQLSFAAMKRHFDASDHEAGRQCLTVGCIDCGGPGA
ncbi:hypothetical protein [Leifsonia shinshuensis]|nr:hypothetical protein [Leifsonia shinshuensis]MDR6970788.1 hypothetical protein [Leifsonia shinshuensis]